MPKKKKTNYGNAIVEIGKKKFGNCGNAIAKNGRKKKILEWNCGNGIAEIGEIFFWSIVAMSLPKMGGKKNVVAEIWGEIKKKMCYVHNIFTTFSQQITSY